MNMFTENVKPRKRGRPPGQTAQGAQTRDRLYATAMGLMTAIPLVFMQKTHRDNSGRSEVVAVIGDIDKQRAIIIDDKYSHGHQLSTSA